MKIGFLKSLPSAVLAGSLAFVSLLSVRVEAAEPCLVSFPPNTMLTADITVYPNYVPGSLDYYHGQTTPSAWFAVSVVSPGQALPVGVYPAFCVDQSHFLPAAYIDVPSNDPTSIYTGNLLSTCDEAALAYTPNHGGTPPVGPPPVVSMETWHKINYILNHKSGHYWWNVQVAINRFVGGLAPNDPLIPPSPDTEGYPTTDAAEINAIVNEANANAAAWTVPCGGVVGTLFSVPDPAQQPPDALLYQIIVVEVPVVCLSCPTETGAKGTVYLSSLHGGAKTAPYTYSIVSGSLPPGLVLDPVTGSISGIPTATGTFSFSAKITDSTPDFPQTKTISCTITIVCNPGVIGSVDLAGIVDTYLFFFANGSQDANWQGASKGFVGNVLVDGIVAKERTSGGVPFAGTIQTSDSTLGAWQSIVNQNPGQAFASVGNAAYVSAMKTKLSAAFTKINGLAVTPGYASVSATALNGLNTQNGISETFVINITSGFSISSKINITGDAGDVFILRWDTDANPANGYQGIVKFQSGGGIVPLGRLKPSNFVHVAGDIDASGGGSNPAAPYPQGPRYNDGTGALIAGASNYNGGGFFTGYWLTTGDPVSGDTHSLSNAIFVGGWYTTSDKFSLTSGTSGVYVAPHCQ